MRVSKKFSGYNIGKHTFSRKQAGTISPVAISSVSCFSESGEPPVKLRRSSRSIYFSEYYYYPVYDTSSVPLFPNFALECSSDSPLPSSPLSTEMEVEPEEWKAVLQYFCEDTFIELNPSAKQETSFTDYHHMCFSPTSSCSYDNHCDRDFQDFDIDPFDNGYDNIENCFEDKELASFILNL
jgi:hypothetical protein